MEPLSIMNRHRWLESRCGEGAVVAATVLILAAALCLLDANRNGVDDPRTDLCNVTLLVAIAVVCLAKPWPNGDSRRNPAPSTRWLSRSSTRLRSPLVS